MGSALRSVVTIAGVSETPDAGVGDRLGEQPGDDATLSLRPPRKAFVLAYLGVVLAGVMGAAIGGGLVDSMCRGDCGTSVALGTITGALVAAVGVAVVAVLVLRAMHEWNQHRARVDIEAIPGPAAPPPGPTC